MGIGQTAQSVKVEEGLKLFNYSLGGTTEIFGVTNNCHKTAVICVVIVATW
jgi:hypothetical protein